VIERFEFDSDQESGSEIASIKEIGTSKPCHFLRQISARADQQQLLKLGPAQVPSQTESAEGLPTAIIGNE